MRRLALTRSRGLALLAMTILVVASMSCAGASADVFLPVTMASNGFLDAETGELQQALYAHDPVVSGNGEYVAFDGNFAGLAGVWRRNLQTGEVQPVAVGAEVSGSESCVGGSACNAELPSISANGQYVSFTTTAALAPFDDRNDAPDVYVRNMDVPESQSCLAAEEEDAKRLEERCAFTLVSAVNEADRGLTYEVPPERAGELGAVASGRSAISESGEEVVFVTTAASNLSGAETPALQVGLRNLLTNQTELVSTEYDPETNQAIPDKPAAVSNSSGTFGAVYSPGGMPPPFPFNNRAYNLTPPVGASISANGTTVAWMGQTVYKQARMLPDEDQGEYTEPLWRRVGDGPLVPTRRVTGGSEPENPACVESGETALTEFHGSGPNPCQGPFAIETLKGGVWQGKAGDPVPQLSANGYTVAFIATAPIVSLGEAFGRNAETEADDLYVVDMHEGLTRSAALQPLTELASGHQEEVGPDGAILDFALSPEGTQVAFSTQRVEFPLPLFAYVSQPAAVPGMAELFDVDLANHTLTRVTRGDEGGPSEHPLLQAIAGVEDPYLRTDGALSPSFSDDGNTLVFASTAANLVFGDGNTPPPVIGYPEGSDDGSDVFDATRESFSSEAVEAYVGAPPANPSVTPEWRLGVTAQSLPDGDVRLYVEVPGGGSLSASVAGSVGLRTSSHAARSRRRGKRAHGSAIVAQRTVASAKQTVAAGAGGLVELTLMLAPSYRTLASSHGGLSGTATIVFAGTGGPTLRQSVAVLFASKASGSHAGSARASRRKRGTRRP
jgi:WD40-like Beta Propeller Repeat